jgi:protoporphyrinogen IX oxidase
MLLWLYSHYEWLRALHIISVIAWMAGMLYLPRLFVYHAATAKGSDTSETFKTMERRLLKIIINPAMILGFVFGALMLAANPALLEAPWMHVKLTCVFLMAGLHGYFAKTVKIFARDQNTRPPKFYRLLNEAPTLFMVVVVFMAVVEPF